MERERAGGDGGTEGRRGREGKREGKRETGRETEGVSCVGRHRQVLCGQVLRE